MNVKISKNYYYFYYYYSTKKKRLFDASKASISKPTGNQIAEIKQILSNDFTKNIPHIHNTFDHNFS